MDDDRSDDRIGQEPRCLRCGGRADSLSRPNAMGALRQRADGRYIHEICAALVSNISTIADVTRSIPKDFLRSISQSPMTSAMAALNAPNVIPYTPPPGAPKRPASIPDPAAPPIAQPPAATPQTPPTKPHGCRRRCTLAADLSTALHEHGEGLSADGAARVIGVDPGHLRKLRGAHGLPRWSRLVQLWRDRGCAVFDGQTCAVSCAVCADRETPDP